MTGSEVLVDLSAILFFLTVIRDAGLEKSTKHQILYINYAYRKVVQMLKLNDGREQI